MRFCELVATSQRMAATRSRLEKQAAVAELLGRAPPGEIALIVSYLSGRTRQGRLGIGYATLAPLRNVEAAAIPALEVAEIDR